MLFNAKALLFLSLSLLTSASPEDVSTLEATDGVVVGHMFPACNGRGSKKPITVPVDRCLTIPRMALEIRTAAVCENGTRAQWARFTDRKCGYGTLDEEYGLVDLEDKDVGTCLDIMKIGSMAFWCDGLKKTSPEDEDSGEPEDDDKEKDQSKKGSVSESACMAGKAPFWNHPKADTCVNLKTDKLQVSSAAICANGTQSTVAFYKESGCLGAPSEFRTVAEEQSRDCLDVEGLSSFAFYCTGEGIERGRGGAGHGRNGSSGSIWQFLLILGLIFLISILMMILSVLTWIQKYGGSLGQLIQFARNLVKPREGGIAI